jgi:hypothetical protein
LLIGQVSLLIVAGWLLGEAMLRLGQPAVMGQSPVMRMLSPGGMGQGLVRRPCLRDPTSRATTVMREIKLRGTTCS